MAVSIFFLFVLNVVLFMPWQKKKANEEVECQIDDDVPGGDMV
jgi:hypothetical protein